VDARAGTRHGVKTRGRRRSRGGVVDMRPVSGRLRAWRGPGGTRRGPAADQAWARGVVSHGRMHVTHPLVVIPGLWYDHDRMGTMHLYRRRPDSSSSGRVVVGQKASNAPPPGKRAVAFPRRVRVRHRFQCSRRIPAHWAASRARASLRAQIASYFMKEPTGEGILTYSQ
jgi:hypothetical protein